VAVPFGGFGLGAREKQRQEKKSQIIEAAARVFAEKGFSRTLIAEIAIQAGIGKGTVYEYFKSKDDLFFDVCQWFMQKSLTEASVDISAPGESVSDRFARMNESVLNSVINMKPLYGLSLEFWSASASSGQREKFQDLFRNMYSAYRQVISSLIRDGINSREYRSDVEPESIASAIIGTWDSLGLQAWFDDGFKIRKVGNDFFQVVIRGLMIQKNLPEEEER